MTIDQLFKTPARDLSTEDLKTRFAHSCNFAFPGTYGHECGKRAMLAASKPCADTKSGVFWVRRCPECATRAIPQRRASPRCEFTTKDIDLLAPMGGATDGVYTRLHRVVDLHDQATQPMLIQGERASLTASDGTQLVTDEAIRAIKEYGWEIIKHINNLDIPGLTPGDAKAIEHACGLLEDREKGTTTHAA